MMPTSVSRGVRPHREGGPLGRAGAWRASVRGVTRAEVRVAVICSALLGGVAVVVLLVQAQVRLRVIEVGYRLSATRQLVERLEVERRELMFRTAAAETPAGLARVARRLGMRRPVRGQEMDLP